MSNSPRESDDLSSRRHRKLIGTLGALLPFILVALAGARPTPGLEDQPLDSVSIYYYTGGVAAFIGVLIALAVFFFTYHGYKNEFQTRDRVTALVAGSAAVVVAFFPTDPSPYVARPSWWTYAMGVAHYIAAVTLFSSFVCFSYFLFPKSKLTRQQQPRDKRIRNSIYHFCGAVIVGCMIWAAVNGRLGRQIFYPESIALEAFALSWLTKGRADETLIVAATVSVQRLRQPRRLFSAAWKTIR